MLHGRLVSLRRRALLLHRYATQIPRANAAAATAPSAANVTQRRIARPRVRSSVSEASARKSGKSPSRKRGQADEREALGRHREQRSRASPPSRAPKAAPRRRQATHVSHAAAASSAEVRDVPERRRAPRGPGRPQGGRARSRAPRPAACTASQSPPSGPSGDGVALPVRLRARERPRVAEPESR